MSSIKQRLSFVSDIKRDFVGTVAFRNDKLTLPDGSKVAIGVDGERWVIVFQGGAKLPFVVYEYSEEKHTILVDKKVGGPEDLERARGIVAYFFEHADVDDVVTIEPGEKI